MSYWSDENFVYKFSKNQWIFKEGVYRSRRPYMKRASSKVPQSSMVIERLSNSTWKDKNNIVISTPLNGLQFLYFTYCPHEHQRSQCLPSVLLLNSLASLNCSWHYWINSLSYSLSCVSCSMRLLLLSTRFTVHHLEWWNQNTVWLNFLSSNQNKKNG